MKVKIETPNEARNKVSQTTKTKNREKLDDLHYLTFSALANGYWIEGYNYDGKFILISKKCYPDRKTALHEFNNGLVVFRNS